MERKEKIVLIAYLVVAALLALVAGVGRGLVNYSDVRPDTARWWLLNFALLAGAVVIFKAYKIVPQRKWIEAGAICVAVIFLFLPPIASGDALSSLFRIKIFALTHTNPYLIAPSQFPGDPWSVGVSWRHIPMPYGPLWLVFSFIFFPFVKGGIGTALFFYKIVMGAAALASGRLLYLFSERMGRDGRKAEMLFLWNPLLVLTVFSDAHNDIIMILLLFLGIYFLLEEKFYFAVSALMASALIKYVSILALPFFALHIYRKLKNIRSVFKVFLPSLILPIFFFAIFWQGEFTFRGVVLASGIISTNSFFVHTASFFGAGFGFFVKAKEWLLGAAAVAVALIFTWSSRQEGRIIKGITFSFVALLLTVTDFFNWYLLWPLCLLPFISEEGKRPWLVVAVTVFGVLHIDRAFWASVVTSIAALAIIWYFEFYAPNIVRLYRKRIFGRVKHEI